MSLRVLHVVESASPEPGSAVVCLCGGFAALQRQSVESSLLPSTGEAGDTGLEVHRLTSIPASAELVRFDVIHLHGWGDGVSRRVARLARSSGTPYFIAPHGALTPGPFRRETWSSRVRRALLDDRLVRDAAALVALNTYEEKELAGRFPDARIIRLPYGLDFDAYSAAVAAPGSAPDASAGRCLLLLGPLEPIEGGVALLKSAAELGRDADGWSIVLAGRDRRNWRAMLEAAVHRKGGEGRVVFCGAADLASQRALLGAAGAVVAPSLHIRPPVSIIQAAAAGKAVVATDCTVPDELREAVSVCRTNRAHLRESLRGLLTISDDARASMGERAREAGRRSLDWSVLAERYVQAYASVV